MGEGSEKSARGGLELAGRSGGIPAGSDLTNSTSGERGLQQARRRGHRRRFLISRRQSRTRRGQHHDERAPLRSSVVAAMHSSTRVMVSIARGTVSSRRYASWSGSRQGRLARSPRGSMVLPVLPLGGTRPHVSRSIGPGGERGASLVCWCDGSYRRVAADAQGAGRATRLLAGSDRAS